ncbi:uncharacterized protein RhoGAP102A isoform X2 [Drosophila montana]|uniref:uncharacterized protein RhoGAP102A isoform X2 n=1 Tax=Drosophila montana TaxID=40370 RepID=UPI00313C18C1
MASKYTKTQALDIKKDIMPSSSGQSVSSLRQPVTVIKKRSGPLDGMIDELHRLEGTTTQKVGLSTTNSHSNITDNQTDANTESSTNCATRHLGKTSSATASASGRRRFQAKDKEKKRERWLLTRKTWRYMTDAGRKLLPEGKPHNAESSIPEIEAQFQRVCASEPRFVLWRRKSSFPGATKSSRKRLKILAQHRGNYATQSQLRNQELNENVDQTIELLQSYLKIRDSYKTTTLLGTKTVRPDQTSSPSSRRPNYDKAQTSSKLSTSSESRPNDVNHESVLLDRLKGISSSSLGGLHVGQITPAILEDKALLKKIYNFLKKQQLHRILHSSEPTKSNLARSTSFSSLFNYTGSDEIIAPIDLSSFENTTKYTINSRELPDPKAKDNRLTKRQQKPPETLDFSHSTKSLQGHALLNRNNNNNNNQSNVNVAREKSLNSCGSQTNFIQLSELKLIAEQYEQMLEIKSEGEEVDKSSLTVNSNHRRRSSIDNEDVSQSVSDTIKRYLRMARKKSIQDGDASRFKSVNYDRNLRNIKAKGEINPPGMDEGNNKAVQTLDAWALVALDFIRGNENSKNLHNAHIAWQKDLDERIRKKMDWEKSFQERNNENNENPPQTKKQPQSVCLSAPTSPTSPIHSPKEKTGRTASAILTSSSHFLSNFWHASSTEPSSTQSLKYGNANDSFINSKNETTNMQKSKSLSNVGQFVSRKIWGSRSKCPSRQNHSQDFVPHRQIWAPSENCTWISEEGQVLQLKDTSLEKLSDIEAEFLMHIALEKIKELNIGTNIDGRDILFGTSLESCLSRDRKRAGGMDTGSKHTLTSVFSSRVGKLNDNVRSYESLPTKSLNSKHGASSDYITNLQKSSSMSMQMSRSQFDMRNVELDLDRILFEESKNSFMLNVPMFIIICIEYLEEHGLQKVGLFRVSTSQKRVKQLREEFDKNCNMRIPDNTCPHDVATLLKEFLRDLPEPLLCKRLYTTFLETQRIRNRRLQLEAISHLIKLLPVVHRDTLYVLLKFLGNVAAHCDDICSPDGTVQMNGNKMDSNNLSTVFAPNILRDYVPKTAEYKEHGNMVDAINVIRIMIDHYEEIFNVPVELVDVLYSHMLDTCPEQLHVLITKKLNQSSNTQVEESKPNENQVHLRDGTYDSALLIDGRRQSTPILLEHPNVFSASLQISMPDESSLQATRANQIQENKVQTTSISEPKLPTSISNIGGATLCAKTAEFEKNTSRNVTHGTQNPTAKAKTLYKRQQLIPSSRR